MGSSATIVDGLAHIEEKPPEAELSVEGLSIRFGGLVVLSDVSLQAKRGELTAVIGPNGAGKTTLFNCISGFYRSYAGSVSLGGEALETRPAAARARMRLSRTFQTPVFIESDSVLENVLIGRHSRTHANLLSTFFGMRWAHREEERSREVAADLLDRLGLSSVAGASIAGLPHRTRRMAEIARALVSEPRVLLLDEPAAGNHHREAVDMLQSILAITTDEVAILLVEHNVPLVMEFADKVAVLDFGHLIATGSPHEVQRDPRVVEAYLGQSIV